MTSSWTHSICVPCWNRRHPSHPTVNIEGSPFAVCCWCLLGHHSGIYVQEQPEVIECNHGDLTTKTSRRSMCCIPKCDREATHLLIHDALGERCSHVVCDTHRYMVNHTAHLL